MKTIYYFAETNADNVVIASDGKNYYECSVNSKGIDINSNVDLYQTDNEGNLDKRKIMRDLKEAYAAIDGLYNMADIERDFPSAIHQFDFDLFERLTEIITID